MFFYVEVWVSMQGNAIKSDVKKKNTETNCRLYGWNNTVKFFTISIKCLGIFRNYSFCIFKSRVIHQSYHVFTTWKSLIHQECKCVNYSVLGEMLWSARSHAKKKNKNEMTASKKKNSSSAIRNISDSYY